MTKRLGYGYEKKATDSPSTQTARCDFLQLTLELRPHIPPTLFATAYQPFSELLANNQSQVNSICELLLAELPESDYLPREPKNIRNMAIKRFIPDWQAIKNIEGANQLRQALLRWSRDQNLTSVWCLDHALAVLRAFDAGKDKINPTQWPAALINDVANMMAESWLWAIQERREDALWRQALCGEELKDLYSFRFNHEKIGFTVSGPIYQSVPQFKEEVRHEFKAAGGKDARGAGKVLELEMKEYLERVGKIAAEKGFEKPPVRWADDHIKWLIHYQISPCMKYREIARKFGANEKTVREGIASTAALIGLKLRSSEPDKHPGRPRGSKTKSTGSGGRTTFKEKSIRANNAGK